MYKVNDIGEGWVRIDCNIKLLGEDYENQMKEHNLSMEEVVKEFSSYVSEELDDYYNYVSNREYQIQLGEMFSDYMRSEYEILEENNE
jgi:hypothetical protein